MQAFRHTRQTYLLYISGCNSGAVRVTDTFTYFLYSDVAYSLAGSDPSFRPISGREERSVKGLTESELPAQLSSAEQSSVSR